MILAPVVTIISLLLALGIITPFNRDKAEALADSQASTLAAGTSKLRIDVRSTSGSPLVYTATGAYDYREQRGRFTYNFTRTPGLDHAAAVEARFFQNTLFLDDPRRDRKAPWLLIDLENDAKRAAGTRSAQLDGAVASTSIDDPTAVLAKMAAAGSIRDRGKVRRFGAELHKYSGTLPAPGGSGRTTATAFIDGDDLIRRLELSREGGKDTTAMQFYDYGVDVDVEAPPPGTFEVYADLLDRLEDQGG